MSIIQSDLLLGQEGSSKYQVSRSLRFSSGDSSYLSRTPASAGNRKTWTFSFWIKRQVSAYQQIFTVDGTTEANYFQFAIENDDKLVVRVANNTNVFKTTQVFRDPSAWYHLVLAVDTTQATSANRVRIYVNGVEITTFDSASYPAQNTDLNVNTTNSHLIGRAKYNGFSASHSDCYLAEIHLIDGQQLTPSSFAETDATTGQWIPKLYSGSYGSQGWKLTFADNSAATATTLGKDVAGSNNWTPNNFSVTAGAGNDSLVDTPTSYGTDTGAGGEVRGNYATWNPLDKGSSMTITNGNLDVSTASTWNTVRATFGLTSGKWYWEYTMTAAGLTMVGIVSTVIGGYTGDSSSGYAFYSLNGNKYNAGATAYGSSFTTNDIIGVAFDADAGKIWYAKNGTWQASGNPAAGTNAAFSSIASRTYFPAISQDNTDGVTGGLLNAGARPFAYTAPSGFKALCDTNLPAPVVAKSSTVMDVKLYTGNGSTQTISGLGFSPDLIWIKSRSAAYDHQLGDTVRGVTNILHSNLTAAESTLNTITGTSSDGFTVSAASFIGTNANGQTFVAWAWDAGSSTVTNTQGSITSSVRANASAGFSIVTYTGNGSSGATIGHSLGVAPAFVAVKRRDAADSWIVYHSSTGNTKYLLLNNTTAATTYSGTWNNAGPSSTTITLGNDVGVNASSGTYVCYAWTPVAGYSSFGSFTGSSDLPFIYTGFKPRWLLLKNAGASGDDWALLDSARNTYNELNSKLWPNTSAAEATLSGNNSVDFLANGFKMRSTNNATNSVGNTMIYACFAESPFQYARAR